jgi:putative intracellular protease/amidase/YHS domain-containing protein
MNKLSYLAALALLAGCSSPGTDTTTQGPATSGQHTATEVSQVPGLQHGKTSGEAPLNVAVLVYPGVELLDFAGPTEVFSTAGNLRVYLVSTGDRQLATNGQTVHLTADYTLATAPQPDILVVPGGPMEVVAAVYRDPAVLAWIKQAHQQTQLTMSVCTGAFILSRAGLTHDKRVTSHWSAVDSLGRFDSQATVLKDQRFVEDGRLLTTAGVSAGIDGALRVVEELRGPEEAKMVARMMQYEKWQPGQGVVFGKSGIRPPAPVAATADRDPVCQMTVAAKDAPTLAYQGKPYRFCSASCRENFRRHPEDYVRN